MPPILPETPRPLVWYAACASTSPDQWSCCVKISQSRWKTWKCCLCLHLALKTNYILVIPFFDSCQAHSWSWKVGPSCYICAVFVFCICILYLSELVYLRWPPCHNPSPPTLYLLPPSLLPPTSSHPASHTHTSSHECSCVLSYISLIYLSNIYLALTFPAPLTMLTSPTFTLLSKTHPTTWIFISNSPYFVFHKNQPGFQHWYWEARWTIAIWKLGPRAFWFGFLVSVSNF